jgi:hypothetical protein
MSEDIRGEPRELLERIRRGLDESAAELDAATLERLHRARHRAVSLATEPRRRWWRPRLQSTEWLLPASAFASVVVTVLTLTLLVGEQGNVPLTGGDDLELLTAGEELELFENLEFYQWLPESELAG